MTHILFLVIFAVIYCYSFNTFSACKECSAMTDIFLSESQCSEDSVCHSRVLKRCKLIVSCIKKLQPLLIELMDCTHPLEDREDSASGHSNLFKKEGMFHIAFVTHCRYRQSPLFRFIGIFS
jgi:hypothetical protein